MRPRKTNRRIKSTLQRKKRKWKEQFETLHSIWWGKANFNLGFALFKAGKYQSAIDAYTLALNVFQTLEDEIQVARVKGAIALLQNYAGDPNSALVMYEEVIAVYKVHQDGPKLAAAIHNKAVVLIKLEEFDEAIEHLATALRLSLQHNRENILPYIHKNMGLAYLGLNQFDVAREELEKALTLAKLVPLPHEITQISLQLSEIYLKQRKINAATGFLEQSYVIARENDYAMLLIDIYKQQSALAKYKGNFRQAYQALSDSNQLKEQIADTDLTNKLTSLNTYFATLRTEHEKALLEKQNIIMQLQVENARQEKMIFAVFSLAGVLIAIMIAMRLRKAAHQAQQFKLQSRLDALTQLPNRTAFLEIAEKHIVENPPKLCFALADIDNFKNINDSYGHDCGDEVLKSVARQFKSLQQSDSGHSRFEVARWGGEEFVFILPNADIDQAEQLLEEIRTQRDASHIHYFEKTLKVTATFGVAQWSAGSRVDEVLKLADEMMYLGKQQGRNRVMAAKK